MDELKSVPWGDHGTISVGDLAFTDTDEPVVVEAFAAFASGDHAAQVRRIAPRGSMETVDCVFAGDLVPYTRQEFEAYIGRPEWVPGDWPPFRRPDQLPEVVGHRWPTRAR